MKTSFYKISALLLLTFIYSCQQNASDVKVSKNMKIFLQMAVGSAENTEKALKIYAASDKIKRTEMIMYDLSQPIITSNEDECYVVEFSTGEIITKIFRICWTEDKITKIEDLGIKENE